MSDTIENVASVGYIERVKDTANNHYDLHYNGFDPSVLAGYTEKDWLQNNSRLTDYIKNRTHYTTNRFELAHPQWNGVLEGSNEYKPALIDLDNSYYKLYKLSDTPRAFNSEFNNAPLDFSSYKITHFIGLDGTHIYVDTELGDNIKLTKVNKDTYTTGDCVYFGNITDEYYQGNIVAILYGGWSIFAPVDGSNNPISFEENIIREADGYSYKINTVNSVDYVTFYSGTNGDVYDNLTIHKRDANGDVNGTFNELFDEEGSLRSTITLANDAGVIYQYGITDGPSVEFVVIDGTQAATVTIKEKQITLDPGVYGIYDSRVETSGAFLSGGALYNNTIVWTVRGEEIVEQLDSKYIQAEVNRISSLEIATATLNTDLNTKMDKTNPVGSGILNFTGDAYFTGKAYSNSKELATKESVTNLQATLTQAIEDEATARTNADVSKLTIANPETLGNTLNVTGNVVASNLLIGAGMPNGVKAYVDSMVGSASSVAGHDRYIGTFTTKVNDASFNIATILPTTNLQENDYAFIINPWNPVVDGTTPTLKKFVCQLDNNDNLVWVYSNDVTIAFSSDQWQTINTALDELNAYKTEATNALNAYKTLVTNTYATIANLNNKMDKVNPTGSGSIVVGANNVNNGKNCAVFGESNTVTSFVEYSFIEGYGNKLGEDYEIVTDYAALMNLNPGEISEGQLYYTENSYIDEYDNNHEYPSGFYRYTGDTIHAYFESADPIKGAHAEGNMTIANGDYSHSEGYRTQTDEESSHAEGSYTIASGEGAHAEGIGGLIDGNQEYTIASGKGAHAEGFVTEATGNYSHAEGSTTTASGNMSHAEGAVTKSIGVCSHAEGQNTTASGNMSHAEGNHTQSYGIGSHAEGYNTTAQGNFSHAEGYYTIAKPVQHVSGYYNQPKVGLEDTDNPYITKVFSFEPNTYTYNLENFFNDDEYREGLWTGNIVYQADGNGNTFSNFSYDEESKQIIFNSIPTEPIYFRFRNAANATLVVVGNGFGTNERSNAYSLDYNGNAHFKGDVYIGCNADSTGGTKLSSVPIPDPPTTDGSYILQVTVSSGVPSYEWKAGNVDDIPFINSQGGGN